MGPALSAADDCHVVSVGWGATLIAAILDPMEDRTGFRFSHLLITERDGQPRSAQPGRGAMLVVRESRDAAMPEPDLAMLSGLERPGVPTIHNMVLADRYAARLPYRQALGYATFLARQFRAHFETLRPTLVIGGFDGLHGGIAHAVARAMGIPWYVMVYTTIPKGMSSFADGMSPDRVVVLAPLTGDALRDTAEQVMGDFERRALVVPAYLSANSLGDVIARLPLHATSLVRSLWRSLSGRFDPYTEESPLRLALQYVRKRWNLFSLGRQDLATEPPAQPFLFFGLHMQPEASVDVWAPFFANQVAVVEALARALPPTHRLMVKLHKSDADNYSRADLDRLRRLPGVDVVSPFASSRAFVDQADIVVAIQGTMGLEAALLGKPVIMFGDSLFRELPSVTMVRAMSELPDVVRRKLSEPRPDRQAILGGYTRFLAAYSPGCYAEWEIPRTPAELEALTRQLQALRDHATRQAR